MRPSVITALLLPALASASAIQASPASILYVAIATVELSSQPTHAPASSLPDFFYLPILHPASPQQALQQAPQTTLALPPPVAATPASNPNPDPNLDPSALLDPRNAAVAAAASTTTTVSPPPPPPPSQYPTVTTQWVPTVLANSQTTWVAVVYTQTFAHVVSQGAGPGVGSIGLGTATASGAAAETGSPGESGAGSIFLERGVGGWMVGRVWGVVVMVGMGFVGLGKGLW